MQTPSVMPVVPDAHRQNFTHLYFDIAWFGLLSGSTISFFTVYLVRIGADALQIGLMNSVPAMMAILLAIPAGGWLKQRNLDRAVFTTSVFYRFFYLIWVPLPLLAQDQNQVWLVIGLTFLMSIPGTALAVAFNAMFADAVPPEWRGQVVGRRNAVLAITTIAASLVSGFILDSVSFPENYQLVFLMGFIGAAMSSFHLHKIRLPEKARASNNLTIGDWAQPGIIKPMGDSIKRSTGLRFLALRIRSKRPTFDILRGPYGVVMLAFFLFNLTLHLTIPLFPIYWVDRLALSDKTISIGTAIFYGTVFLGSTQLSRLTNRFGNKRITVSGALLMAAYPGLTAVTLDVPLYLATSFIGGLAWALAGGAMGNYLLEIIPEEERPDYFAWYTVIVNLAVLSGSLLGPALSRMIGLVPALYIASAGRILSALGLQKIGNNRIRNRSYKDA